MSIRNREIGVPWNTHGEIPFQRQETPQGWWQVRWAVLTLDRGVSERDKIKSEKESTGAGEKVWLICDLPFLLHIVWCQVEFLSYNGREFLMRL